MLRIMKETRKQRTAKYTDAEWELMKVIGFFLKHGPLDYRRELKELNEKYMEVCKDVIKAE